MTSSSLQEPLGLSARSVPIFIAEIEQLGGAERSLLALARWLHQQGVPAHIITYVDHCDFRRFADFPLVVVELKPPSNVISKILALRRYLRSGSAPPPLASGYQPAMHLCLAGVRRFHCLMHDTPVLFDERLRHSARPGLRLLLSNFVIARGFSPKNKMIVTSSFLQRDCWKEFHVHAVIAHMGGMGNAAMFRRRPVENELRILSVCRIEGNKRIDWTLHALAALEATARPLSGKVDWHLDLAGTGSLLENLRDKATQLGLGQRVHFHGFVSDTELDRLYRNAHLFLMPAVQGYGIPAIEALQRGIPVLLHRESGVSDLLMDTPWATVLHGNEEEMGPKLQQVLEWLINNEQMRVVPPPELPTEESWAARVAHLCGYASEARGTEFEPRKSSSGY